VNVSVWLRSEWARAAAVVAAVVGLVLLVAGWVGVSGSSLTTEQIPYLASGAVGGLFALGVAATLWLSADLKDEFAKLDEIYGWLQGNGEAPEAEMAGAEPAAGLAAEFEAEPEAGYTAAVRRRPLRAAGRTGPAEP
jgi:hypothetical protein